MNTQDDIVTGLKILNTYDTEATVERKGDITFVILDETKSNISDEDADKLRDLGWHWEDQEMWMYDPDSFGEEY